MEYSLSLSLSLSLSHTHTHTKRQTAGAPPLHSHQRPGSLLHDIVEHTARPVPKRHVRLGTLTRIVARDTALQRRTRRVDQIVAKVLLARDGRVDGAEAVGDLEAVGAAIVAPVAQSVLELGGPVFDEREGMALVVDGDLVGGVGAG